MNKQPKQGFDVGIIRAVKAYHEFHHDTQVELVRFVCNPVGEPMILTRVVGEDKKKMSCLLEFNWRYVDVNEHEMEQQWEVIERESIERKDEYYMLCHYMTGCDGE